MDVVLHWFRRDLRAEDHAALHAALTSGRKVHCLFVFDTDILDQLDAIAVRIADEAEQRSPLAHAVGRLLGLDPVPRERDERLLHVVQPVAQQRAHELHLSEHELVVATSELDTLHDHLYVMACAVHDAERDLAAAGQRPNAAELRDIIDWILEAARPLVAMYPASDPT